VYETNVTVRIARHEKARALITERR
jgi:hypothetical protein